jgi:hypothetical protein
MGGSLSYFGYYGEIKPSHCPCSVALLNYHSVNLQKLGILFPLDLNFVRRAPLSNVLMYCIQYTKILCTYYRRLSARQTRRQNPPLHSRLRIRTGLHHAARAPVQYEGERPPWGIPELSSGTVYWRLSSRSSSTGVRAVDFLLPGNKMLRCLHFSLADLPVARRSLVDLKKNNKVTKNRSDTRLCNPATSGRQNEATEVVNSSQ